MHLLFVEKYRWKHTEAYDMANLHACTLRVNSLPPVFQRLLDSQLQNLAYSI